MSAVKFGDYPFNHNIRKPQILQLQAKRSLNYLN